MKPCVYYYQIVPVLSNMADFSLSPQAVSAGSNGLENLYRKFLLDREHYFVLIACHSYSVEPCKVGCHVYEVLDLHFLKIDTYYLNNDEGQICTKIEAVFEITE